MSFTPVIPNAEHSDNHGESNPTLQKRTAVWGSLVVLQVVADALKDLGYLLPSKVQQQAIPLLQNGRNVVAQAITGSGKTAAFGLPICEIVDPKGPTAQALVLTPTRELAQQVAREITALGKRKKVRVAALYGGEPIKKQLAQLRQNVPVIIGTPGRIMDHMSRGTLDFRNVKLAVLDEADEMLDIGFADDIEYILSHTPRNRQTALFSATIPGAIMRLIRKYLHNPAWVKLKGAQGLSSVETVADLEQVYFELAARDKDKVLRLLLDESEKGAQMLIFCSRQVIVDNLTISLKRRGYKVQGIHGGMRQTDRNRIIGGFRLGSFRVLAATNLAARGLDIPLITHVINYDMPGNVEEYVHRIGRTARMGRKGMAISFVSEWDFEILKKIKNKIGADKLERRIPSIYR